MCREWTRCSLLLCSLGIPFLLFIKPADISVLFSLSHVVLTGACVIYLPSNSWCSFAKIPLPAKKVIINCLVYTKGVDKMRRHSRTFTRRVRVHFDCTVAWPRLVLFPHVTRFRQCLLGVNDTISSMVGYSFFNILRVPCFELEQRRRCTQMYWWGT